MIDRESVLKFKDGVVDDFTLVLSRRSQEHLGQIVNVSGVTYKRNLNAANEISFTVNREENGIIERLWDEIYDLRLVWISELDEYFEINVSYDEAVNSTKQITGTSLCEAELSQTNLYGVEINTDDDIVDKGHATLIWNQPSGGSGYSPLLERILDVMPHYSMDYTYFPLGLKESTLIPEFTFNDTTVYDALNQVAEQFDCMFQYDSVNRKISVVDLETICPKNDCAYYINENEAYYQYPEINGVKQVTHKHYRGIFNDVCPKCNRAITSNDYFGTDTTICIGVDNLTDQISYSADVGSIKNTIKLEAGDDLMTSYVVQANNGNKFMYNFPEETLRDMSDGANELRARLNYYWEQTKKHNTNYVAATKQYYKCLENYAKYCYSMMPADESEYTPPTDYDKILNENIKFIEDGFRTCGVGLATALKESSGTTSLTTYIYGMSKVYAKTNYVSITRSNISIVGTTTTVINEIKYYNTVTFKVKVDVLDTKENSTTPPSGWTTEITCAISTSDSSISYYANQMQSKIANSTSMSQYDMVALLTYRPQVWAQWSTEFGIQINSWDTLFSTEVINKICQKVEDILLADHKDPEKIGYCQQLISNYVECYGTCVGFLDTLKDKIGDSLFALKKGETEETTTNAFWKMYNKFKNGYNSILKKMQYCLEIRNVDVMKYKYPDAPYNNDKHYAESDSYKKSETYTADMLMKRYQSYMNFEDILMAKDFVTYKANVLSYSNARNTLPSLSSDKKINTYYKEFCTFRREQTYSNSTITSEGIEDKDDSIFDLAYKFINLAKEELIKSSTYQYSISSTLKNFLLIPEFEPLIKYFDVGNWIRFKIGDSDHSIFDEYYRLRLISFEINFDDLQTINCEFSNLTKTANGYNDVTSVLSQASSMATSFGTVSKQAAESTEATKFVSNFVADGLTSALQGISNNDNQDITIDEKGILCRKFDPWEDKYDDEQFRITNNIIAFTNDNWAHVKAALGKHDYKQFGISGNKIAITEKTGYGLTADFLTADSVIAESSLYGANIYGGHIYSRNYDFSGTNKTGSYINLEDGKMYLSDKLTFNGSKLTIKGDIEADNGYFKGDISGSSGTFGTGDYKLELNKSGYYIRSKNFSVKNDGNVSVAGNITATSGTFDNVTINSNCTVNGNISGASGTFAGSLAAGDLYINSGDYYIKAPNFYIDKYGKSEFTGTFTGGGVTLNSGGITSTYFTANSSGASLTGKLNCSGGIFFPDNNGSYYAGFVSEYIYNAADETRNTAVHLVSVPLCIGSQSIRTETDWYAADGARRTLVAMDYKINSQGIYELNFGWDPTTEMNIYDAAGYPSRVYLRGYNIVIGSSNTGSCLVKTAGNGDVHEIIGTDSYTKDKVYYETRIKTIRISSAEDSIVIGCVNGKNYKILGLTVIPES